MSCNKVVEIKFDTYNWWSRPIYRTKMGTPVCQLEEGFYSLADPEDIDSEPCSKLKTECLKIVKEFS